MFFSDDWFTWGAYKVEPLRRVFIPYKTNIIGFIIKNYFYERMVSNNMKGELRTLYMKEIETTSITTKPASPIRYQ